ncbi:MAG: RNase adapter RapZ [Gammaproteobacteria bacterium]
MDQPDTRLILLSGQSGSGKSVAIHELEDEGYYCIDNLPPNLFDSVVDRTIRSGGKLYRHLALGVDARSGNLDLTPVIESCTALRRENLDCLIVFLHTDEEVLIRRYSETRRRHPLSTDQLSLREAIRRERDLLAPLSEEADLTIDTSHKTVHELRTEIRARLNHHQRGRLVLLFESFAFRDGVPLDADLVFDARCLPNPHWEPGLRDLTGLDPAVIQYLGSFNQVGELICDIEQLVTKWLPAFEAQNRSYLTVAIGCTGGRHRSVYVSEVLARRLTSRLTPALVRHLKLEPEAHPPHPDFAPGPPG